MFRDLRLHPHLPQTQNPFREFGRTLFPKHTTSSVVAERMLLQTARDSPNIVGRVHSICTKFSLSASRKISGSCTNRRRLSCKPPFSRDFAPLSTEPTPFMRVPATILIHWGVDCKSPGISMHQPARDPSKTLGYRRGTTRQPKQLLKPLTGRHAQSLWTRPRRPYPCQNGLSNGKVWPASPAISAGDRTRS